MATRPNAHPVTGRVPLLIRGASRAICAAKWLPGGHADIARYEAACEEEGVSLPQSTRDFLRRYGGLVDQI